MINSSVINESGPQATLMALERPRGGVSTARQRTYDSDAFNADCEDVKRQVTGVGEGVFFPQLGEEDIRSCKVLAVEDIIAYFRSMLAILTKVGRC